MERWHLIFDDDREDCITMAIGCIVIAALVLALLVGLPDGQEANTEPDILSDAISETDASSADAFEVETA